MWNLLAPLALALALTGCDQGSVALAAGVEQPAGPVDVAVDTGAGRAPISPFVYGFNGTGAGDSPPGTTWLRVGGNRWTTYNWETNWSNAGSDYGFHNDLHLGAPADGAAHAAVQALAHAKANGLGYVATIPIQGWVAGDARDEGTLASVTTVDRTGATVATSGRFLPNRPAKGSAFSATPSTTDGSVYQDELAWVLASRWSGAATPLHLELDNEPDLWFETHREVQPSRISYEELLARSIASAAAIKEAAPGAVVLGPVSYGWNGYVYLQDAPDKHTYGDFLDYYLDRMAAASATAGKRLLDVLDLHYYTEAESAAGPASPPWAGPRTTAPRRSSRPGSSRPAPWRPATSSRAGSSAPDRRAGRGPHPADAREDRRPLPGDPPRPHRVQLRRGEPRQRRGGPGRRPRALRPRGALRRGLLAALQRRRLHLGARRLARLPELRRGRLELRRHLGAGHLHRPRPPGGLREHAPGRAPARWCSSSSTGRRWWAARWSGGAARCGSP